MLSPCSGQSPLSVVRVRTYSRHELISVFSCYCPGHVRVHRQLSESARIVTVILPEVSHSIALILPEPTVSSQSPHLYSPWSLSGLMVDYHNLNMCFTDCHSNRDFRTIYMWNEINQFSINCIPMINHQSNIYYIHEQLQILIVDYCLQIPECSSRCFPILTIDCVDPVFMYCQDHFWYLWLDNFPLFE